MMDIRAITADSSVQRMGTRKETMDPINFDGAGLPQRISQTLIKAILDRTLRGGDRLVETELQKHFGVSRSPLREAFRDLEKRGLVEIRARRGTFVKKITRKDINEHYPVLAVLEGLAARQAHAHVNEAIGKAMAGELKAMEAGARDGDVELFLEHHGRFHHIYIEASGNQLLIDMIMDLRLRGTMLRYFYPHTPAYCKQSLAIHHRILSGLRDAEEDPGQVEQLVRGHIEEMLVLKEWEL
jgi:DNA-binding GntR family transcriptional regulator